MAAKESKIIPTIETFSKMLVIDHIKEGISETIKILGADQVSFRPVIIEKRWKSSAEITVIMDIKMVDEPMQVRLHFESAPIIFILESMLGSKVEPKSADLLDGIGEISNMIYGLIKTKASNNGFTMGMSRPVACFAENAPAIAGRNHYSIVIPFQVNTHPCFFEFVAFE